MKVLPQKREKWRKKVKESSSINEKQRRWQQSLKKSPLLKDSTKDSSTFWTKVDYTANNLWK